MRRIPTKPFLDAARRDWQFAAFAWLLRNCGGYTKFLDTTLVLPVADHFPDSGMKGHAGAAALFRRVRDHAGMADWPCTVEPEASEAGVARPRSLRDGIAVIRYREAADSRLLIASFARELAHVLIDTFDEAAPGGAPLHDPAVDLAAVFMGFGIFMANAEFATARCALNEGELVHALALFCLLRKLDPATIDGHLNPHLRKYLRLAARDLAQHEARFRELRAVFAGMPFDVGECTLPTRGD
jgi:hypothetical protein